MRLAPVVPTLLALAALGCGSSGAATGPDASGDTAVSDSTGGSDVTEAAAEASGDAGGDATAPTDAGAADGVSPDAPIDAPPMADGGPLSFHGFVIGRFVVGSMAVVVGTDRLVGPAGVFPASGTIALPGGVPTPMTGTYDRATTRLTLSGGGFSVSDIASGSVFGGDVNGGDAGAIFYDVGLDPATTYCGTLQGPTAGVVALNEYALFLPGDSGSFFPTVDVGIATTPWVQVYPGGLASDGGVYCAMSLGVVVQGGIGDAGAAGVWTQSYEAGAGLFAGDGGTWTATITECPPL